MGGIAEFLIFFPSRCNIGSKMGRIALFVKNNDPEAIFDFFVPKRYGTQIDCHTSEVLVILVV